MGGFGSLNPSQVVCAWGQLTLEGGSVGWKNFECVFRLFFAVFGLDESVGAPPPGLWVVGFWPGKDSPLSLCLGSPQGNCHLPPYSLTSQVTVSRGCGDLA